METQNQYSWENEEKGNKIKDDKKKDSIFLTIRDFNSSPKMILIFNILSIFIVIYYVNKFLKEGIGDGFSVVIIIFFTVYLFSVLAPKIFPNSKIAKRGKLFYGIIQFLLIVVLYLVIFLLK